MVATLITRRNHWNDLFYRDDPTIMGWELANEPHMPGDDSGIVLKARLIRVELPCSWGPKQPWDGWRFVVAWDGWRFVCGMGWLAVCLRQTSSCQQMTLTLKPVTSWAAPSRARR